MTKDTHWFFMLPSTNEAEIRHIYDIAFGVRCLISKNIDYSDITILIDNSSYAKVTLCFSNMGIPIPKKIYMTSDLEKLLQNNKHKNAVVFITGHGSPEGLDTPIPLKPFPLYKKFQTSQNFEKVVFYFGQCYAGIFDKMPLSSHLGVSSNTACNIIALGSTGLFPSISAPLCVGALRWSANLFLAYVMECIMNPKDVDGDDRFSVMDSFKSASVKTAAMLIDIKKKDNLQSIIEQAELQKCIDRLSSTQISPSDKDNLDLEIQALEKILEVRYTIQEPWILNTQAALDTEF